MFVAVLLCVAVCCCLLLCLAARRRHRCSIQPTQSPQSINKTPTAITDKARHFYFVLEGEVVLERSGVTLQRVREGEFLVRALAERVVVMMD